MGDPGPDQAYPALRTSGPGARAEDHSLLPSDRSFAGLLPAFLLPYAAYVGLGAIPAQVLGPAAVGAGRFCLVALLLWIFRERYRFGPALTPRQVLISLGGAAAALALWILAYRFSLALPWWRTHLAAAETAGLTPAYWAVRAANSVLLVPLAEELFCRAYLGGFFFALPQSPGGTAARLGLRLDDHPVPLAAPPLSVPGVLATTAFFTLGHDLSAWLPAILYFGLTTWIYARTGSFRICIAIHALVNLGIAGLVLWMPGMRYLWF